METGPVCQFFYVRALENYYLLSRLQGFEKKITQTYLAF
jgi:hypothetical protein